MAEFGSGGGTGGGGLPASPGPVQGKVAFKAGDGEGGGGGGGGGRSSCDSAGSRVSNGDCALAGAGEEPGSAPPASPESSGKEKGFSTSQQREGKPGIPRRSSIIKVRVLAPPHRGLGFLCDRGREMGTIDVAHRPLALDERIGGFFFFFSPLCWEDLIFPLSEVDNSERMALYRSMLEGSGGGASCFKAY